MRKPIRALAALVTSAVLGAALLYALGADEGGSDGESRTRGQEVKRGGSDQDSRSGRDRGAAKLAATPGSLAGSGELKVVGGSSRRAAKGPLKRFAIEVERGLEIDQPAFAREVERTLFDPRSWARGGGFSLQRVGNVEGAAFRVILAGPETTDRLCHPLPTNGIFSCYQGSRAVLNARLWRDGAPAFGGTLARYRRYMVNHEVGHALGHRQHRACPAAGARAPVMMQQTKGLGSCKPNAWPLDSER